MGTMPSDPQPSLPATRHTFGPATVRYTIEEGSELYVETYTHPNGLTSMYFASRPHPSASWGPPTELSQGS